MKKRIVIAVSVVILALCAGVAYKGRRFLLRRLHPAANDRVFASGTPDVPVNPAAVMQPPRLNAWKIIGPGGGGAQYYPAISPLDPNVMLVACDMGAAYISIDGGKLWRQFNVGANVTGFAFDAKNPAVIYALGKIGLFRSDDTGKSWNIAYPAPASLESLNFAGDEGGAMLFAKEGSVTAITALASDPRRPATLYATIGRQAAMSSDGGTSWKILGLFPSGSGIRIFLGATNVYFVSTDRTAIWDGAAWKENAPPLNAKWIYDASGGVAPDGSVILYAVIDSPAVGDQGLIVSKDGGITWQDAEANFLNGVPDRRKPPRLRAVAASLNHPETIYISYSNYAGFFGVAKTSDAGATWSLVMKEDDKTAANVQEAWLSDHYGPDWPENPAGIAVSATNPDIVITTDLGRTMRSGDGGRNWEAAYSQRIAPGFYSTTGLDVTTCYEVYFDPFDPKRIFIAYTDIGLFRSEDGGQSWTSSVNGVARAWSNTTYSMAFDPQVKGRVWAAMSRNHDLPRPGTMRRFQSADYRGGIMVSDDGGRNWKKSNRGMAETAPTHILMDPKSASGNRTLYVAAIGMGVYKSTDDGHSWLLKSAGLPANPAVWRLARDREGMLYAVIARRSSDGNFGNAADGALYRSIDDGESWEQVMLPAGVNGPTGLAIDPEDSTRLYLSTWCRSDPSSGKASSGGILLSTDRGKSWTPAETINQYAYDVTIDPRDRNVLYSAGFQGSVMRSGDRGTTWTRIPGFNFMAGQRVIPDPRDKDKIYVTTFGGGVWYGPSRVLENQSDDIATPRLLKLLRFR